MENNNDFYKVLPLQQRWRIFLNRGKRLLKQGDFQGAMRVFRKAHQQAPEEPLVLLALGREYLRQAELEKAEPLLRGAFEKQPQSNAAASCLARLLGLHKRQVGDAIAVLQLAESSGAKVLPLRVIHGEILLETGQYSEARKIFKELLSATGDPSTLEAARVGLAQTYNLEAITYSNQGRLEEAVFLLKHAIDLEPEWSGPYVNLGVVFDALGKPHKAIDSYLAALKRDILNPVAYFNLGTAQHQCGLLTQAVQSFEELLSLAPDYPHVRGALANVLGDMKQFDHAIALFLEELEINPSCVSCWSSLGLAYICSGSPERGEQCLLRALQIEPLYFNAIHNLARLYLTQKKFLLAEGMIQRASKIDPERTSQLMAKNGRIDAAENLLQEQ